LKGWIFAVGVALQLPLLVLWAMGAGSSQGSRGRHSLAADPERGHARVASFHALPFAALSSALIFCG